MSKFKVLNNKQVLSLLQHPQRSLCQCRPSLSQNSLNFLLRSRYPAQFSLPHQYQASTYHFSNPSFGIQKHPLRCFNSSFNSQSEPLTILRIPKNVSIMKLSNLINVPSEQLFEQVHQLTHELVADEFQIISDEAVELLCIENEIDVEIEDVPKNNPNWRKRAPIVTIMGHVDHGKTTLLDALRHSKKVDEEYGDITQSIGAFTFVTDSGHELTFIDTPGHEAFHNLRERGALVTDLIILVVSGIEGIQPQTLEVIELIKQHRIPVIVAINKIDRPGAEPERVMEELKQEGLVPIEHGGDVPCIPISAKKKENLDQLEDVLIKVANQKVQLMEDFSEQAQCFVIESNLDEKSHQISATVIVRKGTLRHEDVFVCGEHEGRVRFMINDQGKKVTEAFPGEAVLLAGFKTLPNVGTSLYACKGYKEAGAISQYYKRRNELERERQAGANDPSQKVHDLKKSVGKLSRLERRLVYGGDKQIMLQKMGLIDRKDVEEYRRKLGISKELDLDSEESISAVQDKLEERLAEKKARKMGLRMAKQKFKHEEFQKILQDYQEQQQQMKTMTEDEILKMQVEKQQMREIFSGQTVDLYPIIIKAPSAGVLETLLSESQKILQGKYRIQIMSASVGAINETDITNAANSGAIIVGFDVKCNPLASKSASGMGVRVRLHKIIYKFLEDLQDFADDAQIDIDRQFGRNVTQEVVASAEVQQIFKIKGVKQPVLGCKVQAGTLEKKSKFRLVRDGEVIADNLKLSSMKKVQQDVSRVDRNEECGLVLDFDGQVEEDDVLESYVEKQHGELKFNHKPGVSQTY